MCLLNMMGKKDTRVRVIDAHSTRVKHVMKINNSLIHVRLWKMKININYKKSIVLTEHDGQERYTRASDRCPQASLIANQQHTRPLHHHPFEVWLPGNNPAPVECLCLLQTKHYLIGAKRSYTYFVPLMLKCQPSLKLNNNYNTNNTNNNNNNNDDDDERSD